MSIPHTLVKSKKTILKAILFDVKEEGLLLKNNSKKTHTTVFRSPTVCVLPVDEDSNVYLIEEYRYNFEKIILEAVAGFVNKNEKPLDAAKRELIEEAGIKAKKWELLKVLQLAASVTISNIYIYKAQELEFIKSMPEEDEEIKLVKMPLNKAIEDIMKNEIVTSSTLAGLFLLKNTL